MDENLKTPKISVLLPVYNGGEYLQTAIDSILNQSYSDFEFIIINDASTDNSEKLICSYTDSRIRYIKNEQNIGLIRTLNKGLDLCNGDYIARMDQDDIANDKRLEKQNDILDKNPEIGVCGSWFTLFGTRNNHVAKHPEHPEHIKIGMLAYCAIGHPTVMMRKSSLQGLKYDEDYQAAEDYEFWTRLLRITKFYNIQESLLDYRLHETNMSVKENSIQSINTTRIVENQLAYIGLDRNLDFVKYCYILFRDFNPKVSTEEFIKLVSFANIFENANHKKVFFLIEALPALYHKVLR